MVFTGAKRSRPTSSAAAPSKTSIAAPIAVSSWNTAGDEESLGSTVLRFTIIGSPSTPERSASTADSVRRLIQRLFVLKKRWRSMSWKASSSSSRTCALSRSTSPPPARRAMWPPLRSASARLSTSIANGSRSRATQARMRGSSTAPRLSELAISAYS